MNASIQAMAIRGAMVRARVTIPTQPTLLKETPRGRGQGLDEAEVLDKMTLMASFAGWTTRTSPFVLTSSTA